MFSLYLKIPPERGGWLLYRLLKNVSILTNYLGEIFNQILETQKGDFHLKSDTCIKYTPGVGHLISLLICEEIWKKFSFSDGMCTITDVGVKVDII